MAYRLPDFNVTANLWFPPIPVIPPATPPDATVPAQLYFHSRADNELVAGASIRDNIPSLQLRVAAGTLPQAGALVECPAGSGEYFHMTWVGPVHLGFPNEYQVGLVIHDFYYH